MQNTKKDRINLYDNLKFLLIILVVVGHMVDLHTGEIDVYKSVYIFIYAFHMPLFMFISGQFHNNKNVLSKALTFVSIGFLLKIVISIMPLILYGANPKFSLLKDVGIPWYMFVLAGCLAVSYVLRGIDKKYILIMSVLIACFVGYDSSIGDYFYLSRFIVFYPFYVLGQMIDKHTIIEVSASKITKFTGVAVIAMWAVMCFFNLDLVYELRPLFTGRNPFSVNEIFLKWGFLYRFLCYLITISTGFAIISLIPAKKIPVITKSGANTLQVFFWHWPVILILEKLKIDQILLGTSIGKIGWVLCGVIVGLVLSLKIFHFPTKNVATSCEKVEFTKNKDTIRPKDY